VTKKGRNPSRDFDRAAILAHFGDLWPVHNRGFLAILIECRRHFGGDLDQMLILTLIGERTLTAQRAKGLSYQSFLAGERGEGAPRRINTQSISDSTGIPRETVRRKLSALVERGWVRKDAGGSYLVTEQAAVELRPATETSFDYLVALGNAIRALPEAGSSGESRRLAGAK
jgi:hypothetical protein